MIAVASFIKAMLNKICILYKRNIKNLSILFTTVYRYLLGYQSKLCIIFQTLIKILIGKNWHLY